MSEATHTTKVLVEWIRGDRRMSEFMKNAGLGLNGAGIKERSIITYETVEEVTEERALAAITNMAKQADKERADFVIMCPKVISITRQ